MPEFLGQRIVSLLLVAIEDRLSVLPSPVSASARWPQMHRRASYERAGFEPYKIIYQKAAVVG
jgi:hypothetical protein